MAFHFLGFYLTKALTLLKTSILNSSLISAKYSYIWFNNFSMFSSLQILSRIDTAKEDSDLLESYIKLSISCVFWIRLLRIWLLISLLSNFKATNLLMLLDESKNTLRTYTIGARSLFERLLISHNALAASNTIISWLLLTFLKRYSKNSFS